jgi:hypothetical protein
MGWKLEASKQFAAAALVISVPSTAITYFFPRNDIPVVGRVGRTVLKYIPQPLNRIEGGSALSDAYFNEFNAQTLDGTFSLKSPEDLSRMDEDERKGYEAFMKYAERSRAALQLSKDQLKCAEDRLKAINTYLDLLKSGMPVDAEGYLKREKNYLISQGCDIK